MLLSQIILFGFVYPDKRQNVPNWVMDELMRRLSVSRPNPIKATAASVAEGKEHFATFCIPCHGAEAKGGISGPVATKFIPTPDLTSQALQKQRTDGYWHSYIVTGGAVMPSYGEALSSTEAWHIVNFLRSVAAK